MLHKRALAIGTAAMRISASTGTISMEQEDRFSGVEAAYFDRLP